MMSGLSWMAWTTPVALFFGSIVALLIGMTVWEVRSPTVPRRGWLPLVTTRGDRLFIGLLLCALANLLWMALTDQSLWWMTPVTLLLLAGTLRWG